MKFPFDEKTTISRLRVPYSRDQLAVRLRYLRLFGGMNLHPASLPPNAVVCIRNLRDPSPRQSLINQAGLQFSNNLQNSILSEIEKLYRRAFRAVRETVPANAEAVVFSDKSELLACLADDWCNGNLNQNWWWKSLFPNLETVQPVARIWLESAEFVPAALEILVKKTAVTKFVKKLQPQETVELLKKVVETFGLKKLQNALSESLTIKEKFAVKEAAEKRKEILTENFSTEFFQPSEIFIEFVPEIKSQGLTFEKELFAGIGLMLARAPRVVRSETFALRVRKLKIETEFISEKVYEKTETISLPMIEKKTFQPETGKNPELKKVEIKRSESSESKPEDETLQQKKKNTAFHEPEKTEKQPEKFSVKFSDYKEEKRKIKSEKKAAAKDFERSKPEAVAEIKKTEAKTKIIPPAEEKHTSAISETYIETAEPETVKPEEFETIIHTNFGGIFYLLNLGLFLKLYSDFSEPLESEIDLNIWDFTALLSRYFLGERIENDAVWDLLKRLAERESDENFGDDFNPPDEWRMPVEWLKTFQKKEIWFRLKSKKRLIVRHSENFKVIDVPLEKNFKIQLARELKNYSQYFSETVESKTKIPNKNLRARERFFENLNEFAERRLLQSLNHETRDELNKTLFEKSAIVTVSAANLDLRLSLNDLPLAVRFSGLDRNPGWIPAAGKYVKFHFV